MLSCSCCICLTFLQFCAFSSHDCLSLLSKFPHSCIGRIWRAFLSCGSFLYVSISYVSRMLSNYNSCICKTFLLRQSFPLCFQFFSPTPMLFVHQPMDSQPSLFLFLLPSDQIRPDKTELFCSHLINRIRCSTWNPSKSCWRGRKVKVFIVKVCSWMNLQFYVL